MQVNHAVLVLHVVKRANNARLYVQKLSLARLSGHQNRRWMTSGAVGQR